MLGIKKWDQSGAKSIEDLATCATSFPEGDYASMKSCYTGIVTELREGDKLVVEVVGGDVSVDFQVKNSFFGAILLKET